MYVEMDNPKIATDKEDHDSLSELYKGQVAKFSNPQWFTISPDTRHYTQRSQVITEWISIIHKWLYPSCRDYVFVLELDDERPHFHGVCDIKDYISFSSKYWTIKNGNNSRLHAEFKKGGLSYLFKDSDKTYLHTGVQPVYEYGDWVTSLARKKEARHKIQMERREEYLKEEVRNTPSWMLNSDSE